MKSEEVFQLIEKVLNENNGIVKKEQLKIGRAHV